MSEIDLEHLKSWEGKQEILEDDISLFPARALAAALDLDELPKKGDELPRSGSGSTFCPRQKPH